MTIKEELQKRTREAKHKPNHLTVVTDYLSEQCRLAAELGNYEAEIEDINEFLLPDGQILTENDVKEFAERENLLYRHIWSYALTICATLSWSEEE